MTVTEAGTAELDLRAARARVDEVLRSLLAQKETGPCGEHLAVPLEVLRDFLRGGKRVRPLYCWVGWHAAGGGPEEEAMLRVAAGLELFHAFALLHDDVIDRSDTRRGAPTVHRVLAARSGGPRGDWYGQSAAILLGDLCQVWSAELFGALEPAPAEGSLTSPRGLIDRMRAEMLVGQLLDVAQPDGGFRSADSALRVAYYKTTLYSVKRPLQIGAALAGADGPVLDALAAYAEPLGEAFQLHNDLEDLSPRDRGTGGDDLREGKQTVVLALAVERASAAQAGRLRELVGSADLDDAGVSEARALIEATGAPATVRGMIARKRQQALTAVDRAGFSAASRAALMRVADLGLSGFVPPGGA
ncbi:polyprenyl synthetase family protein [Kitasatospora misakiensis]|uniref:polyprenyl synthetase family protein n=1 Tax=Kitasatospora misakiensis TaxID=67330 RepID=UPI0036D27608